MMATINKRDVLGEDSSVVRSDQVIAKQGISSYPPPRQIELHHAKAIRLELSKVYRDMRSGQINTSDGTKLAYVLEMLRKSHETAILQDRIELLELATNFKKTT